MMRSRSPRLLLRIRRGLRLDFEARSLSSTTAPDRAWHEMLARLDAEEAERRLEAMEAALNSGGRRPG